MVQDGGHRDARGEIAQVGQRDAVSVAHPVVVRRVGEHQRQHALLLEIAFVDARERARQDRRAAEIARRHRGVLAARPLAVVLVPDDDPLLPRRLVGAGDLGDFDTALPGEQVRRPAALAGEGVHRPQEHVVADPVEVAAEAQPEAGRGDVVGGRLALRLEKERHLDEIRVHHRVERLQQLQPLAVLRDLQLDAVGIIRRRHEPFARADEPALGDFRRLLRRPQRPRSVLAGERVGQRVERQPPRQSVRHGDLRTPHEGEGLGVGVVPPREVAVERRDDGVALPLLDLVAPPLSDARTAGVRQDRGADRLESRHLPVPLDGLEDLVASRGHQERHGHPRPVLVGLQRHVRGAGDVLVGRVGARADQGHRDRVGVVVLGHRPRHLGDRTRQVGGMRSDQVRLQPRQVDLDHLLEEALRIRFDLRVGRHQVRAGLRQVGERRAVGGAQVRVHLRVEGEDRGRGPQLGPHVGDRPLAGAGDGAGAGAEVLDDPVRPPLDGQDAEHLQDDVLRGGPAGQLAHKTHADDRRVEHLPGKPGHHVDRIRPAHADRRHRESPRVRSVRVGADHQPAREGVVLQHDLVDDAGPRLPEADAELGAGGAQELEDLPVLLQGRSQIRRGTGARLDEVVAVHRRGDRDPLASRLDELQERHLRRGVLHRHAVGAQHQIAAARLEILAPRIVQVAQHDLLGQGERPFQAAPHGRQAPLHLLVDREDVLGGAVDEVHDPSPE